MASGLAAAPLPVDKPLPGDRPVTDGVGEWLSTLEDDDLADMYNVNEFTNAVGLLSEINDSGYLGSVVDAPSQSVRILWSGEQTPLLEEILGEASELGLSSSIELRPYTRAELQKISETVLASDELKAQGITATQIAAIAGDNADVVVSVVLADSAKDSRLDNVKTAVDAVAEIDVKVEFGSPTLLARKSDTSPFWGGGLLQSASGPCSTGFTLRFGTTNRTTTARHCQPIYPYTAYSGVATGTPYGTTYSTNSYGAVAITGTGAGYVFDGGPTGTARLAVKGFSDVGVGSGVCTSGGNTGVHCGLIVQNLGMWVNDGYGTFGAILAASPSYQMVAAGGDSGGPVIVPWSGGGVGAAGMIQAGDPSPMSSCGPMNIPSSCYWGVLFSSTHSISDTWGAPLVTQ